MKKSIIKSLFVSLTALLISNAVMGQQDPLFTQYIQNPMAVNPAYAGSLDVLNVSLLSRIQWTGFDGAPRTNYLSVASPLADDRIAVGINLVNDKLGPITQNGIFADAAYTLPITGNTNINFGLRAGGNFFSAGIGSLELYNDAQSDIAFSQNINSKFLPNLGFGAYLQNEKYYAGISAPRLLTNEVQTSGGEVTVQTSRAFTEARHFYFMGGGLFEINPSITLKPSASVRVVSGAPLAVDLTLQALVSETFWIGAFYRFSESVGGIIQLQANDQLKIGYSYDHTISGLSGYVGGTHEIFISYDLSFSGSKLRSPRYF